MKDTEIAALHEHDLAAFLEKIGLSEALANEDLVCIVCGQTLKSNLGAVRARGEDFVIVCNRLDCLENFFTDHE